MNQTSEWVATVDCHYIYPEHAAAYLLIESEGAAYIDNNTRHSVPYLLEALNQRGLGPADLKYTIPTHLHLDHAGGTSALAEACLNATVLVHPRGVRHLVDPSRLVAGVKAVYGEEEFDHLYGRLDPIDPARIRAVEDNEELVFGRRTLRFMHTRGHANHHICIYDTGSNGVFTGDAFGVEYKRSRPSRRPFLVCSSAPTDFDPDEARKSIDRILATGAERVFVAHYGEVEDIQGGAQTIRESIGRMERILAEAAASPIEGPDLLSFCEQRVKQAFRETAEACGAEIDPVDWPLFETHININAQGLIYAAKKRHP